MISEIHPCCKQTKKYIFSYTQPVYTYPYNLFEVISDSLTINMFFLQLHIFFCSHFKFCNRIVRNTYPYNYIFHLLPLQYQFPVNFLSA